LRGAEKSLAQPATAPKAASTAQSESRRIILSPRFQNRPYHAESKLGSLEGKAAGGTMSSPGIPRPAQLCVIAMVSKRPLFRTAPDTGVEKPAEKTLKRFSGIFD
jgi:hypothetical protein